MTILEMLPRLVPVEDEEISKELEKHFKKSGIRIETGAKAENIRKDANGVSPHGDAGERQQRGDAIREAPGRCRAPAQHGQHRPREYKGAVGPRLRGR